MMAAKVAGTCGYLWGLVRHLHSILENERREMRARLRGQPQAEALVHPVGGELLAQTLQSRHP